MRLPERLPSDINEAIEYLRTGGLAEVSGIADAAYHTGTQRLESEPAMMLALCMLAHMGIVMDAASRRAEGLPEWAIEMAAAITLEGDNTAAILDEIGKALVLAHSIGRAGALDDAARAADATNDVAQAVEAIMALPTGMP